MQIKFICLGAFNLKVILNALHKTIDQVTTADLGGTDLKPLRAGVVHKASFYHWIKKYCFAHVNID